MSKKLLLGLITLLIIGGPILYLFLINANNTQAAWFDDNWTYRKAITVTVTSSASDISNLQTLLTVDTTGITAKVQSSCQDLRFTSATGALLPYYIDTCSNNSATNKIWVMADLVPKNTDKYTMYMYYGNPSISSASDATLFYDVRGLKGYWTFNESSWNGTSGEVKDSSVSANHGTSTADPTLPSITTGQTGYSNAGSFTAGHVNLSDPSLVITNQITVSAWVYQTNNTTNGAYQGIITKWICCADRGWRLNSDFGVPSWTVSSGFSSGEVRGSSISLNQWYLLTGTYDGSTIRLYINGVLNNTVAYTAGLADAPGGIPMIGADTQFPAARIFKGKIDDVRVYNRVLSATEISQLYSKTATIASTATTTSKPSTSFADEEKGTGPITYWRFDEGTGSTTNNSIANSGSNLQGTTTSITWQTEDQCIAGKCLFFNGTSSNVTVSGTATGTQTASFWVKPIAFSATTPLIQLTSGAYITTNSSGTLSSTGLTSASYYVNGVSSTSLTANSWQFVTVTFSSIDANAIILANQSTNYLNGFMDEVKLYANTRSAEQIKTDYISRGSTEGSSSVIASDPRSNLANGLVGYWKMDETATPSIDSSGNGNSGTWAGNVAAATGKFGKAGAFDGSNDYISVTDPSSGVLDFGTSSFSVSTWFKLNTLTTHNTFIAKSNGGITMAAGYMWNTDNANGVLRFAISDGTNAYGVDTTETFDDDAWHLGTVIVDRTAQSIKVYVDGTQRSTSVLSIGGNFSSTFPTGSVNNALNFLIGAESDDALSFNGELDEVRVYNRALSSAEISQLYNFAPGPVGYWDFNENTGISANDTSGNANTGTWNGTGSHWTPGKYGSSGKFNASDDDVTVSSPSNLDITNGTIEAWINIRWADSFTVANPFVAGVRTTGSTRYSIHIGSSTVCTTASTQCIGLYNGTTYVAVDLGSPMSKNVWHHIAITVSGGTMYVYVDGLLKGSAAQTIGSTTGIPFHIGGSPWNTNEYFNGYVDDVRIYNYPRSAKQIVEDMNAGHPAVGSPVGSAIGHWRFDEGADNTCSGGTNDACNSGNGGSALDGAQSGMAVPATSTSGWTQAGKFGKALLFDGSNDYVNLTTNSSTNFGSTNDFTLSTWIYPTTLNTYNTIISRRVNSPSIQGYHLFVRSTGAINFSSFNGGVLVDSLNTATGIISTNNWYHITLTHASGGNTTIYVNGVSRLSQATGSGDFSTSSTALLVGSQNPATPTDFFTGSIDEVKVYNYALTTSEIALDMNRGSSQVLGALSDKTVAGYEGGNQAANQEYCIPGDSTSCAVPVGRWDFEEGTGITLYDRSVSSNNGTWNGTGTLHWIPGKMGGGGGFNGSDDYIALPDEFRASDTAGTISGWFKINQWTASRATIFSWGSTNAVAAHTWNIRINNSDDSSAPSDGNAYLTIRFVGNGVTSQDLVGNTLISRNTWYQFAVTGDGSTYKMYLNGIPQTLTAVGGAGANSGKWIGAATAPSGTNKARLGDAFFQNAEQAWINGYLDSIRYYNYARSAAQVAWDYNRGAPVAHWRFDECQGAVAYDDSKNGNNVSNGNNGTITVGGAPNTAVGTCTGSANTMWKDGATGKYNSSLDFDGTDDYVDIGSKTALQITGDLSFGAWIYINTAVNDSGIITTGAAASETQANNANYLADLATTSGNDIRYIHEYSAGSNEDTTFDANLSASTWYHVFLVRNTTAKTVKLYINGIQTGSTFTYTNNPDGGTTNSLNIGRDINGSVYFNGRIDDTQIYNYALTATQVKTLYNQGAVRFGPSSGTP